ncbi:hypothetical protein II906_00945, partial [bacterium]|nr:hypothetical protein [bacterium]
MRINSISSFRPAFNGISKKVTERADNDGRCMVPRKLLEDDKQLILIGKKKGENLRPSDSGKVADFSV